MLTAALRVLGLRVALVGVLCLVASEAGLSQTQAIPNANQIQRAIQNQQNQQNQSTAGQVQSLNPNIEVFQPVAPEERLPAPPSRLESLYAARARSGPPAPQRIRQGQETAQQNPVLTQFGYDILGVATPFSSTQIGAAQDSYILGSDDEIVVVLRGPEDQTYTERVNRDGQIILPRLNPIAATGRTLGEFRADVQRQVARTYFSTNAFVSLGQVRQISVLLTGEVRSPGTRILSALATPLDALLLSGGIAKTGSLRNVALIRGNQVRTIDLYSLLTQGNAVTLETLQNGDRIYVPPLENTVAVSGLVRHPGIYELQDGETSLDAKALVRLAGGFEIAGTYRLSKISLEPDGSTRFVPLPNGGRVANGEILSVDNAVDLRTETVELRGAVKLPNAYPLATTPSVRKLIRSANDLTPDAYTAFAVIARRDLTLNVTNVDAFSLSRVLSGQQDIPLQNEDILYVFTHDDIRRLANAVATQQAANGARGSPAPVGTGNAANLGTGNSAELDTRLAAAAMLTGGAPQNNQAPQQAPQNGQGYQGAPYNQPGLYGQGTQTGLPGQNTMLNIPAGTAAQQSVNGAGTQGGQNSTQFPSVGAPTSVGVALADAAAAINRETGIVNSGGGVGADIARTLGVSEQALTGTVGENLVWLFDEIKDPGVYLAAQGTSLGDLVQMAGGPLRTADLSAVEVTSTTIDVSTGTSRTIRTDYKGTIDDLKKVTLQPLDVVRFRPIFSDRETGRVTVTGEVRYPGTLDIRRGERLSSVLARAGGLTEEAYPYGAVFTRRSAAVAESEANLREATELETALATAIQRGSLTSNLTDTALPVGQPGVPGAPVGTGASGVIGTLIAELRTTPAFGRITVTADPAELQVKPELDIVMDGGDTIYIPKRPSTVTVTGEVLNTGSFEYRNDFDVQDYVDMAGGTRESADDDRIFVVMPDGSARPVQESWLTFSHNNIIPPGSTIVVPRDVAPFNFVTSLTNITTITSQLAMTLATFALLRGLHL